MITRARLLITFRQNGFSICVSPLPPLSEGAAPPDYMPARVKLPELTLKKFSGYLAKWNSFCDTFESTIHRSPVPVEYLPSIRRELGDQHTR